jgi:hypothetical protein
MRSPVRLGATRLKQAGSSALILVALGSCGWLTGPPRPVWVEGGGGGQFPPGQFLLGVGQGSSSTQASEQAYAAVSKIFKAEITAQAKDWESYLAVETRGRPSVEHRLTIDHVTQVTTDKVLENVQILDSWFDRKPRQYYALAGMNRSQAERAMVERLAELDHTIQTEVTEAHQTTDKLAHVRNLKRAAKNLVLREAYNTDLRVIRPSGQGNPAAYRVGDLTKELEEYLATNLGVAVELSGDHSEPVRRALIDGLAREGFSVVDQSPSSGAGSAELRIQGMLRVRPIEVHDPQFRYVRWCADAMVEEMSSHRVIEAVSKGGREGHVTEREAAAKAVRVMQQEFATDLARAVASQVYGESADQSASDPVPSGCPSELGQLQKNY